MTSHRRVARLQPGVPPEPREGRGSARRRDAVVEQGRDALEHEPRGVHVGDPGPLLELGPADGPVRSVQQDLKILGDRRVLLGRSALLQLRDGLAVRRAQARLDAGR